MDIIRFKKLAESFSAIPVYRRFYADTITPVSLFLRLRKGARYPVLLESVEGGEQLARYSFIARDPYQVLGLTEGDVWKEDSSGVRDTLKRPFFEVLNQEVSKYQEAKLPELPRLTAGAIGFCSYDTIRLTEDIPQNVEDDLNIPDAMWAFYDELYVFDHVKHQVLLIKTIRLNESDNDLEARYQHAQIALDRMEQALRTTETPSVGEVHIGDSISSNIEKNVFEEMVEKAKKYIYEGDIFQVVLSQRFETEVQGDSFQIYRALRSINPSPYLFYLDFHSMKLVGSSPEVLVRVQDGEVVVLPIAGTRKRGETQQEDLELEEELMSDPKEMAEHVMLVDLGRNDLTRVAEPSSVGVTRSAHIVRYSHVMHIVSEVSGVLSEVHSAVDALKYCFPAGTVSGAPKVRAMEIIDELEPSKRGPYAGAVGYFDFSGNMDTCIAIRTMLVKGDKLYVQAGAGIVADSVPENEYFETVNKAGALTEALKMVQSGERNMIL